MSPWMGSSDVRRLEVHALQRTVACPDSRTHSRLHCETAQNEKPGPYCVIGGASPNFKLPLPIE
jgi:hypothetical protein